MLLFESFKNIESTCQEYKIRNYTINPDGTVDVDGDVNLSNGGLTEIPLKFGRVTGFFDCIGNYLSSLEGAPDWVGDHFNCFNNKLTTLEGGPKEVGGNFYCFGNNLTSLEGSPEWIGGNFMCNNNNLTSLEGGPKKVGGYFDCDNNQLTSLEGGPKEVVGYFCCTYNNLTSLEGSPKYVGYFDCSWNNLTSLEGGPEEVSFDFDCEGNPIYGIYKLFTDYKSFQDSLDYGYLRGTDIVRSRFEEALEEIGVKIPESIEGYQYI